MHEPCSISATPQRKRKKIRKKERKIMEVRKIVLVQA
jgi:hypothetical protein